MLQHKSEYSGKIVHLVRANDGQIIGNYISETKGGDKKLMLKGVESLAVKIDNDLDNNKCRLF